LKVFVSVGTHPQPFDRLLREIDRLVGDKKVKAQVFAQTGNCVYRPKSFPGSRLLGSDEFEKKIRWADVVVSHAGAGTIISALREKKPLVLVPRLQKFGEHTNDHQLDLARALAAEKKALAVFDLSELEKRISEAGSFRPDVSSGREMLVKRLSAFLGGVK
jgi:UDP-N-acetylglucosamine transferase subunit ALG13